MTLSFLLCTAHMWVWVSSFQPIKARCTILTCQRSSEKNQMCSAVSFRLVGFSKSFWGNSSSCVSSALRSQSLEFGCEPRRCVCLCTWVMSFISTLSQTGIFFGGVGGVAWLVCVHTRLRRGHGLTPQPLGGDTHMYTHGNNLTTIISSHKVTLSLKLKRIILTCSGKNVLVE